MRVLVRQQPPHLREEYPGLICGMVQDTLHDTTQLLNKVQGLEDTIKSAVGADAASDATWATQSVRHALHELLEVQRDSCGTGY